ESPTGLESYPTANVRPLLLFRRPHRRHVRVRLPEIDRQRALHRQAQDESASLARLALHDDVAAVLAEDLATDRQSQAGALRALAADEWLEDVVELFWGDADAVVHN